MAFLFSQAAPYLTFRTQQYRAKKEIKSRIKNGVPESELFIFEVNEILNSKSVSWEKFGKEFHYKGTMYDVVSSTVINGKLVYKCINDDQEKQLFVNLDKLLQEATGKNKQGQNNIKTSFLSLYDLSVVTEFYLGNNFTSHKTFFTEQKIDLPFISIMAPPPDRSI